MEESPHGVPNDYISQVKNRLDHRLWWFPIPALASFALVLILTGHLLPSLNPRLGNPVNLTVFPAAREEEGAIWLAIFPRGDEMILTTSQKKVFRFPLKQAVPDDFTAFRDYLEGVLKKEAVSFALNMEAPPTRMTAVLAVDERLTYAHIRPFLYTLASVGITQYGFETKIH